MTTKMLTALVVLVLAATATFFGGALRSARGVAPTALAGAQSVEDFKAGFALNASTALLVKNLQSTLAADPKDEHSWALLGLAYQQRARETGDPSYYTKSGGALERARSLDSKDGLVYSGLGSLALSRHRFRQALALGREAQALDPYAARPHGVIGDAFVELGRYRQAFREFDTMVELRPSLSSYTRVSYGRELLGHTVAAVRAMKLAVDAATDTTEPNAWTHVQLGKLYFSHGRYGAARRELRFALRVFPGYPYALDALAQDEAALGRLDRAVTLERQAASAVPLPQYVAFLGDLYRVTGRPRFARRQYAVIGAISRLLRANGVKTDLEIALFEADHGIRLREALDLARLGERDRPSIDGEDVLAWSLERSGHCEEALVHSQRALRLGTRDALKFFHRAMIERCLGNRSAEQFWLHRALALNPNFSILWSPVARRLAS